MHDASGSPNYRCGVECADAHAARAQAVRLLCESAHHAAQKGFPETASTTVRDSEGGIVLRVKLALTSEWEPETAERPPERPT
ncbi:DUF6894 family protein [Methylobacterium terricola]|uniref:DUF6894 family protein n=1 Tax=Methylobacterium terricola TaxID=2583531 RepID=UPI003CCC5E49